MSIILSILIRYIIIIIVTVNCVSSYGNIAINDWIPIKISDTIVKSNEKSIIDITLSTDNACVLDRVKISWNCRHSTAADQYWCMSNKNMASGIVITAGSSSVSESANRRAIMYTYVDLETESEEHTKEKGLIRCELNEDHCVPTVSRFSILPNKEQQTEQLSSYRHLLLEFNTPTNCPLLKNARDVNTALELVPPLSESSRVEGFWREGCQQLELEVSSSYVDALAATHAQGGHIQVEPRRYLPKLLESSTNDTSLVTKQKEDSMISTSAVIRPSEHGNYLVFALDKNSNNRISDLYNLKVHVCNEGKTDVPGNDISVNSEIGHITVIPSLRARLKDDKHPLSLANVDSTSNESSAPFIKKEVEMSGVLTITGEEPIRFSHTAFKALDRGTWSLSLWLKMMEEPNGTYRAFLHKGSPDGSERTPSAWFLPETNRIALRVSTEDNPDVGAETRTIMPIGEWTMVTFVFNNHTIVGDSTFSMEQDLDTFYPSYYLSNIRNFEPQKDHSEERKNYNYTIAVYLNGKLDVELNFLSGVKGNAHPLQLFKDISHSGPRSFVSDLTLWSGPLSQVDALNLYLQGRNSGTGSEIALDETLKVLSEANSNLLLSVKKKEPHDFDRFDRSSNEDSAAQALLSYAKNALQNCEYFERRLDLYAEAAERGSAEALFNWAMLLKYGNEASATNCGISGAGTYTSTTSNDPDDASSIEGVGNWISSFLTNAADTERAFGGVSSLPKAEIDDLNIQFDQERATYALLTAADMGYAPALVPLAVILLTGLGAEPILYPNSILHRHFQIPLHSTYHHQETSSTGDSSNDDNTCGEVSSSEVFVFNRNEKHFRTSKLHTALANYLMKGRSNICFSESNSTETSSNLLTSVMDQIYCTSPDGPNMNIISSSEKDTGKATQLALGLLHIAALHGVAEAHLALAHRYQHGIGGVLKKDIEVAAQYSLLPLRRASDEFHAVGGQPLVEADRIDDDTAPQVERGNLGDEDELIQHQIVRAKEGHLPSILAMADLYYYGARGLARNQPEALRYFEEAANRGSPVGMCGAANMYLKGEGTSSGQPNVTRAIELYENATESPGGSIQALNGLGYLYFFGKQVPLNQSKAFGYFMSAVENPELANGDSFFNAGYCLEHGLGVEPNISKAIELYTTAAKTRGNFDSIASLARMYLEGNGVPRHIPTAMHYLTAATGIGPWIGWLRRGLDQYLHGLHPRSLSCYLHAGELGFEVAQSNAAYVLRSKLKLPTVSYINYFAVQSRSGHETDISTENSIAATNSSSLKNDWLSALQLRQLTSATYLFSEKSVTHVTADHFLHIGNCYFKGSCGLQKADFSRAIWYYTKASYMGQPLSSAYLGAMNHFGLGGIDVNIVRANRYYDQAVKQIAQLEHQQQQSQKRASNMRQISSLVTSLQYALSLRDYSIMTPFVVGVDYAVKSLWYST